MSVSEADNSCLKYGRVSPKNSYYQYMILTVALTIDKIYQNCTNQMNYLYF